MTRDKTQIAPEILADIEWFREIVAKYRGGEIDEDGFAPKRLLMGVYGQRQGGDNQMFRIKVPYGGLNAEKLRKVADVAEKYGNGKAHFTTRENIQIHFVKFDKVMNTMEEMAEAGLFTREACGNTVRNVIGCPLSGVCKHELFDITPHVHSLVFHILRHPDFSNLPRKFKMSFSGCPFPCPDCKANEPIAFIHDLAFVAAIKDGKNGFEIYVGGGLGNTPKFAHKFEDFTPADEIIRTAEAILRVFIEHGDRKNRNRARIKFLVQKFGFTEFKKLVLKAKEKLPKYELKHPDLTEHPNSAEFNMTADYGDLEYIQWHKNNVVTQKQDGFSAITVALPIGDIEAKALRELADVVDKFSSGYVRSSPSQNVILRWVKNSNLPALYKELKRIGVAEASANTILDVTSCPGASTCKIAFTHSKNLGTELRKVMLTSNGLFKDLNLSVKISGCPNACGQHHIADIGFYGVTKKIGTLEIPAYQVVIQGGLTKGAPAFGVPLGKVPARLVPQAFKSMVGFYKLKKLADETFYDFVERIGEDEIKKVIGHYFTYEPTPFENPDVYKDVGLEEQFTVKMMEGECAK